VERRRTEERERAIRERPMEKGGGLEVKSAREGDAGTEILSWAWR
jgi:hypothetical protein